MYFDVSLIYIYYGLSNLPLILQAMQVMTILYNDIDDNFYLIRMKKILN